MVTLSRKEYARLVSRPKQSTFDRSAKSGKGNPYLRSLMDPCDVTGVKVPDVTSFPTATFQVYDRTTATLTSGQAFGFCWQPLLNSWATTTGNLGVAAWAAWAQYTGYTTLNNVFHMVRPVSACVRITNMSATSNNAGEVAYSLLAPSENFQTAITSFDSCARRFNSYRSPLKEATEFLWMPLDPATRMFTTPATTSSTGVVGANSPAICAVISGGATGQSVVFEWYVNFEAVPELSTYNFVNASAPYISNSDLEEATGVMTKLGKLGRQLGEDIGAWLMDQGAIAAGRLGAAAAGGAVHYMTNVVRQRMDGHAHSRLLTLD